MTASLQVQPWDGDLEAVSECPACGDHRRADELEGLQDLSFGAASGLWALKRCLGCQVLYLDPRPHPVSLHLAYRQYYTHHRPTAALRGWVSRLKQALKDGYRNRYFGTRLRPALAAGALVVPLFPKIAAIIRSEDRGLGRPQRPQSRVLDVGCGSGQFLTLARLLGWMPYGIEPDAAAAAVARAQGCDILARDVRELDARYEQLFDVVTLSHVIEHLYDPVDTLRHCLRVLKPGGQIWLETPNIQSMGYEIYGRSWRGLEAPRHLVLFNQAALCSCLERAGFERVRVLPPRELGNDLYRFSATMQLGKIAERDAESLPRVVHVEIDRAMKRARRAVSHDPTRAEFIAAVGYRPE